MKKYGKQIIAFLISAGCIYMAFRNVDFHQALKIFSHGRVRLLPLLVFMTLCVVVMWLRAWRWRYFFRPEHQATTAGLTVANLIGFMTNNILPLRVGEMVRAWMARRKTRAHLSYILAGLVIERLFDTLSLLLILILPLLFMQGVPDFLHKTGLLMSFVFLGAVAFFLLLRVKPNAAQKVISAPARRLLSPHAFERLEHALHIFTDGLGILRDGPAMLKISLLSVLHWAAVVLAYYLSFVGFSFDSLPWTAPFLTLGLVGVGIALPSAPAGVGPVHYAIIKALNGVYGIDIDLAGGFAVIMHLLMMAPVTIIGLWLMWREGLSLHLIREKAVDTGNEPSLREGEPLEVQPTDQ